MSCMKRTLAITSFLTPALHLRNTSATLLPGTGSAGDKGGMGQEINPKVTAPSATWLRGPASYNSLYSTLNLRSGKWYWEITASGNCVVAALARLPSLSVTGQSACALDGQVDVEVDVGMSAWSWAFGSDSSAISLWHNSKTTVYRIAKPQSHVISVALDADKGHAWFAVDGSWITDPAKGSDPTVRAYSDDGPRCGFSAAIGRRCETGLVSVSLVTLASALKYPPPADFEAVTQSPCDCTQSRVACMEQGGCVDEQMSKIACQDCIASSCTYSQCGLDTRKCSAQIGSPECIQCMNSYEQCSLPECDCIQNLYQCMHARKCPISATSEGSVLLDSQHDARTRKIFVDTRFYTEMCISHKVRTRMCALVTICVNGCLQTRCKAKCCCDMCTNLRRGFITGFILQQCDREKDTQCRELLGYPRAEVKCSQDFIACQETVFTRQFELNLIPKR